MLDLIQTLADIIGAIADFDIGALMDEIDSLAGHLIYAFQDAIVLIAEFFVDEIKEKWDLLF